MDSQIANNQEGGSSVSAKTLKEMAKSAIGIPFIDVPEDFDFKGYYSQFHPYKKLHDTTVAEEQEIVKPFTKGHVVEVTDKSQFKGFADDLPNDSLFAVIKIEDPEYKQLLLDHPEKVKQGGSAGILVYDPENQYGSEKYDYVHYAAVPKGAFGERAKVWNACLGGVECINELRANAYKVKIKTPCQLMKEENDHSFHIGDQTKFIAMGDKGEDPNPNGKPESEGEGGTKPDQAQTGAIKFPKVNLTTKDNRSQNGEQKGETAEEAIKRIQDAANEAIAKTQEAYNTVTKELDSTRKRERTAAMSTVIPKTLFEGKDKEYQAELESRVNGNQTIEEVKEIWDGRLAQAQFIQTLERPENKELALSLGNSVPDNVIRAHAEHDKIPDEERNIRINRLSSMFSLEVGY